MVWRVELLVEEWWCWCKNGGVGGRMVMFVVWRVELLAEEWWRWWKSDGVGGRVMVLVEE